MDARAAGTGGPDTPVDLAGVGPGAAARVRLRSRPRAARRRCPLRDRRPGIGERGGISAPRAPQCLLAGGLSALPLPGLSGDGIESDRRQSDPGHSLVGHDLPGLLDRSSPLRARGTRSPRRLAAGVHTVADHLPGQHAQRGPVRLAHARRLRALPSFPAMAVGRGERSRFRACGAGPTRRVPPARPRRAVGGSRRVASSAASRHDRIRRHALRAVALGSPKHARAS